MPAGSTNRQHRKSEALGCCCACLRCLCCTVGQRQQHGHAAPAAPQHDLEQRARDAARRLRDLTKISASLR